MSLRFVAPIGASWRWPHPAEPRKHRNGRLLETALGELRFPRASWVPTKIHVLVSAAGQPVGPG